MNENDKIRKLFELTEKSLSAEDTERIRFGVWRRVRRHRKVVRARFAIGTLVVLILAGAIAYKGFLANGENGMNLAYFMGETQLANELSKLPMEDVVFNMLGTEGDSIFYALIGERYAIEYAFALLGEEEQGKIISGLRDF